LNTKFFPNVQLNLQNFNSKNATGYAMETIQALTQENYSRGFLIDEDLMAGVTAHPEDQEQFVAFVLRHTTGEYLGYQPFPSLERALQAINQIPRPWTFEKISGGCGGGKCGTGNCAKGGCKVGNCCSKPQTNTLSET
jgi:hypothetical protein